MIERSWRSPEAHSTRALHPGLESAPRRATRAVSERGLGRGLGVLLFIVLLLGAGVGHGWAQEDSVLGRAAQSRIRGDTAAPVVVYEIADFQCPHCARFSQEVFPEIDHAYIQTGKVRWIFVNLPLPTHPRAWSAAKAALCAGGVADRFWALQGRLFETQREWSAADDPIALFERYVKDAEIPIEPYRRCMVTDEVAPTLVEDLLFVASAQINSTPTFVIDGSNAFVGYKSFEEWREILDQALEEKAAQP